MEKKGILESWKEISDYLGHSIKTCQRWENNFALPVHRLDKKIKGRVYADTAELDDWIKDKLSLAVASGAGLPKFRSLAVLPIRNLSGDKEKDFLSDGITETLITELGQISAFRVISHQSVRQFQGKQLSIAEISKALRVDAVVEGALLQANDKVRLSVNLVSAFPERHVWAQTYESTRLELAWLQRRIAHSLAEQAGVDLMPGDKARLSNLQAVNPGAYEAYLQGKACVQKSFLKAEIERALAYHIKALEIDPKFAPAYAEVAWCYSQLGHYYHMAPREAFTKLKEMAKRALELDPALADGYAVLGMAGAVYDWNWLEAERLFKHALDLNPYSHRANFFYAQYLSWVGRCEESVKLQHDLIDLDPVNPETQWNLGWCFFWARRYDESEAVFKKLMESSPENHWLEMALGTTCIQKGVRGQALSYCDKARAGVPLGIDTQFDCSTAYIYGLAGEKEKAQGILTEMMRRSKKELVDFTLIAIVQLSLGNYDEALAWLDKAYQERSPTLVFIKIAPFFGAVQDDPRFRELIRRMNFPE